MSATDKDDREYTGGSVNYYKIQVTAPTTEGATPYTAECNDIIEALGMNYAEGNAFKAIWRSCAARNLGLSKRGYDDAKYDAEKVVFFGNRMVRMAEEMLSGAKPEVVGAYLATGPDRTVISGVMKPADPREPLFTLEGRPVFKGDRVLGAYAEGDKFVHYCDELDVVDGRLVACQTYPRSDARTGTAPLGTLYWPKETATAQVEKSCATCKHSHAPSGADPCVSCAVPGYGLTKWEPQS